MEIDGKEHQLHRKITDTCWQLEELKTGLLVTKELHELLQMVAKQQLTFPASIPPSKRGLDNPQVPEIAKLRRTYVLAVLDVPNSRKQMEPAINEVWKRLKQPTKPPGWISVYRWKTRFLQSKNDIRVLTDNASNKGNTTNRYPSVVTRFCEEAISAKYLRRERNTIQETFEDALLRVMKENELRPDSDQLQMPTRRLITRLIADIPAFDKYSARYGHDATLRRFRHVKGHRFVSAPLERAEIDHTHLDLFVVDDKTSLPLGRPYVTACIDSYTRCILGIYVGFNPPSYQSVAACLKDCFLPKVHLKEEYPEIVNEWTAHGVMRQLVVDGGQEFYSKSLEQVCLTLGIEWCAAPRREPWFKGKIERFFGTFNRGIAHGIPGTTFSNIFEKDDYDPSKHAVVKFSTLKWIIRKWIADVYHQGIHRALETTPARMWASSIRPEDIRLPDGSTHLDAIMGRVYRRVLAHKGIEFEGLFYSSPELNELRIKEGSNLEVEIRVDENDIGSIYVVWPKTNSTYRVPARDIEYANGISLWQHSIFKKWQKDRDPFNQNPYGWLKAQEEIQRRIEEDLHLKRRRTRMRVARFKEASEKTSVQRGTREATLILPEAPIHPSTRDLTTESGALESAPVEGFSYRPVEEIEDGGLNFTAMYKKGYEVE
ncbi:MAG: DDE-type integrase/transposase/recombinase [Terracidiphilus sp.]